MNRLVEFREAAVKHFAFLTKRGFRTPIEKLEKHACWLTFKSPRVSVLLCYGPPEFHAELAFWRNAVPKARFGVGNLVVLGQQPKSWTSAPGTKGVEAEVSALASAVLSVEERLCTGEDVFYELLSSAQRVAHKEWVAAEKLSNLRSKAEAAWKNKRYAEVARLYRSAPDNLTVVEQKRLAYAEKNSKQEAQ